MPIAVQWWATWYPGAEPGGGSYIAQRMLASKSERDALGGVLFFNIAHYVLRPWPWILVGLASLIVFPTLGDIHTAFPNLPDKWLRDAVADRARLVRALPAGYVGLMVGGLIAAASSTILTHLNWGASYLVHDFYRRFVSRDRSEKHYVMAGRLATVGLFVAAAVLTLEIDSAAQAFNIILQIGAGTGLLYLLRWFWWRINAWCEIVAMISSFACSVVLMIINNHLAAANEAVIPDHVALVATVGFTTVCWVLAAFLTPATDMETLVAFYRKVRPAGPGWERVRLAANMTKEEARDAGDNLPLAMLGWTAGVCAIWSSLFTVGKFLYGQTTAGFELMAVFVVSGSVLVYVTNRIWSKKAVVEPVAV